MSEQESQAVHTVVVNAEEQYSLWPAATPVPAGWTETGHRGTHAECLAHIESVWTDLRPLSVR
ncbi:MULTISPECIES: MbtH family protein [Streptomyces]|uniref:MbtH family protein n=1 Tax=Streptomyces TaxID=1883 RepID=UPI000F76EE47|nr:MbtH family protein [Streptomyces sp. WAC01280]RSS57426.1 MbtH family protein [Streptomyces sp. WAC01280]